MIDSHLRHKIDTRQARLAVMGLGYVGLPLSLLFAEAGFTVTDYDVDPEYVRSLRAGRSRITDVTSERLLAALEQDRFQPTALPEHLAAADIYLICVPTPLSKTRQPDLSYIGQAIDTLATHWQPGSLVVLESTTYPGTTDEVLLESLRQGGAELDRDFPVGVQPRTGRPRQCRPSARHHSQGGRWGQ